MSDEIDSGFQIDHLAGKVIDGANDSFDVEKYLGEGLTSVVYQAKAKSDGNLVALKILRPNMEEDVVENFWRETAILQDLQRNDITAVPKVYAAERFGPIKFMAMELISEEKYPSIASTIQNDGPFSEADTLEIARQSFLVLQTLHTRLTRSYTDMQLVNFRWDAKNRQLKIIDWNHVSPTKDDLETAIKRSAEKGSAFDESPVFIRMMQGRNAENFEDLIRLDITRMASYIYTIATGKGAAEKGETEWRLMNRAGEIAWGKLSMAIRRFLLTVLVPSKWQGQIVTAQDALARIEGIIELNQNEDVIGMQDRVDELGEILTASAEGNAEMDELERYTTLYQVEALLGRLEMLGNGDKSLERWIAIKQKMMFGLKEEESPNFKRGRRYYDSGNFASAAEQWAEEAKRTEKIEYIRWWQVAAVLAANSSKLDGSKFQTLKLLLETAANTWLLENLPDTQTSLSKAKQIVQSDEMLDWMDQELRALRKMDELEESALQEQNEKLRTVLNDIGEMSFIAKAPYCAQLMKNATWQNRLSKILSREAIEGLANSAETISEKSDLGMAIQAARRAMDAKLTRPASLEALLKELKARPIAFDVFITKNKLALADHPGDQEVIDNAIGYLQQTNKVEERLRLIEQLLGFAALSPTRKQEVQKAKTTVLKSIYENHIKAVEENVANRNLDSAFFRLKKAKGRASELDILEPSSSPERQKKLVELANKIGTEQKILSDLEKAIEEYKKDRAIRSTIDQARKMIEMIEASIINFPKDMQDVLYLKQRLREEVRPPLEGLREQYKGSFSLSKLWSEAQRELVSVDKLMGMLDRIDQNMFQLFDEASLNLRYYKKSGEESKLDKAREQLEMLKKDWANLKLGRN